MVSSIAWSPEALENVESIAEYISRDSPSYAHAVVAKIVSTARDIPQFPNLGRIVPEVGDSDSC
jgi:toxin ParE1/3/4